MFLAYFAKNIYETDTWSWISIWTWLSWMPYNCSCLADIHTYLKQVYMTFFVWMGCLHVWMYCTVFGQRCVYWTQSTANRWRSTTSWTVWPGILSTWHNVMYAGVWHHFSPMIYDNLKNMVCWSDYISVHTKLRSILHMKII